MQIMIPPNATRQARPCGPRPRPQRGFPLTNIRTTSERAYKQCPSWNRLSHLNLSTTAIEICERFLTLPPVFAPDGIFAPHRLLTGPQDGSAGCLYHHLEISPIDPASAASRQAVHVLSISVATRGFAQSRSVCARLRYGRNGFARSL